MNCAHYIILGRFDLNDATPHVHHACGEVIEFVKGIGLGVLRGDHAISMIKICSCYMIFSKRTTLVFLSMVS